MVFSNVSLIDFPDCLLLQLLQYLDSSTLYNLTKVNKRFETLVLDTSLWKKIDARSGPSSNEKNAYCLQRVNRSTSHLCLKGNETKLPPMITVHTLVNFPQNLTVLALENQYIEEPDISLNCFPGTLVELSLKRSILMNSSLFFKKTSERMEKLKVLLLDECSFINSSVVMSVSKYPNLEILSCVKCEIENSIPYFSIAALHGFKKLKVFDVRLSGLGNLFLKSMIRCKNVMAFYFQNMDVSYILDFQDRHLELKREGKTAPEVKFKSLNTAGSEDTLITDKGTSELKRTRARNAVMELPISFLYKDPYGTCTCRFMDRNKNNKCPERKSLENPSTSSHNASVTSEETSCQVNSTDNIDSRCQISEQNDEGQILQQFEPNKKDDQCSSLKRTAQNASLNNSCSISNTETIEFVQNNENGGSGGPPVKKLKSDTENDKKSNSPMCPGPSIKISWRNDKNRLSGNHQYESHTAPSTSTTMNQEAELSSTSDRIKSKPNSDSEPKPSTSSSNNAEKNDKCTENGTSEVDHRQGQDGGAQPGAGPDLDRFAVVLRNMQQDRNDERNNVLEICLRGNRYRNPNDDNPFRDEDEIRLGRGFNVPIVVLNAVRMINFPEVVIDNNLVNGHCVAYKRLSFRGYAKVTDATLASIEHLNLDLLDVTYTKVTKEGVMGFLRLNPNCRVVHKEFCVCRPLMHF